MRHFVRVSSDEWQVDKGGRTASALYSGPEFEEVVRLIASTAAVLEYRREGRRGRPSHNRVIVRFAVDTEKVNLFHNSASGYRAQYYVSPELGDEANALIVRSLTARAVAILAGHSKRTCPLDWVTLSMEQPSAKVWIHQGMWLRHARRSDERLRVERWYRYRQHQDVNARRRPRWAALLPDSEASLEVKGAFVTNRGEVIDSLKPDRARQLHEHGFT
jgi:hypothetical protein